MYSAEYSEGWGSCILTTPLRGTSCEKAILQYLNSVIENPNWSLINYFLVRFRVNDQRPSSLGSCKQYPNSINKSIFG